GHLRSLGRSAASFGSEITLSDEVSTDWRCVSSRVVRPSDVSRETPAVLRCQLAKGHPGAHVHHLEWAG
ncbi:MAG: hypothetical protein AB7I38_17110, partial [Dehalococcoidia bacterium]